MKQYIITAESEKEDKRAIFYSPQIGKGRLYRSSLNNPQKGLKILVYKTKSIAQKICDHTNKLHKDNFKLETI